MNALLGGILNGEIKDVALAPDFYNALDLAARVLCTALVGQRGGFCDDLHGRVRCGRWYAGQNVQG